MTWTSANAVRQRIQDPPKYYDNANMLGDGTANRFMLPHVNIMSASAFVPLNATSWTATGATFNPSGYVDFSGVISALSAFRVSYVYTIFSDEAIGEYISASGINGAILQCAYDLYFDGFKRAKWRSPDGSEYDDTAALQALDKLIDKLKEEQFEDATQYGGFQSWSLTQGDY